jgi:hypothetical protein
MVDEDQAIEELSSQAEPRAQLEEKMIPQSQVNSLIGSTKARAEAAARQKAEAEYQQKLEELQREKQMAESRGDDTRDIDVDSLYQQFQERLNREMQERQLSEHMSEVVRNYHGQMASGKELYDDFEDVTKIFNPAEFPRIVYLTQKMDNAADIFYELSKNPEKLGVINSLADSSPGAAQAALQKLSKSIATNKAALEQEAGGKTNAPLDRMQASTRTSGNGQMSVSDLKGQDWLRG